MTDRGWEVCLDHRWVYRSVPLIRPFENMPPPLSFPPKFLHRVVWLVTTPPGEHRRLSFCMEHLNYTCACVKSSRCYSSAGNTRKCPVVQYCCSGGWLQQSCRECYGPHVEVAALLADVGRPRMMTSTFMLLKRIQWEFGYCHSYQ